MASVNSLASVDEILAPGASNELMSTVVFAVGIPVFWWAQHECRPGQPVFNKYERIGVVLLLAVAVLALVLFLNGTVQIT